MSQHAVHTGQWEGFQQFQDISETNHTQLPEIRKHKANPKRQQGFHHIPNHKNVKKQLKQILNTSNHQPPLEKVEKQVQTIVLPIEQKSTSKAQAKRYQRIPIIRFDQDCRYGGRIVYKSFIPKTSDKYLRTLKEVDWDLPKDKKREVKNLHGIEFNSQFEGGNLNLAIEDFRSRI